MPGIFSFASWSTKIKNIKKYVCLFTVQVFVNILLVGNVFFRGETAC